jgi:hypothetical protein
VQCKEEVGSAAGRTLYPLRVTRILVSAIIITRSGTAERVINAHQGYLGLSCSPNIGGRRGMKNSRLRFWESALAPSRETANIEHVVCTF